MNFKDLLWEQKSRFKVEVYKPLWTF